MAQRFLGGVFGNCRPSTALISDTTGVYDLNGQYYIKQEGGWVEPFSASGGSEFTPGDGYKYHVWKVSDNGTPTGSMVVTGQPNPSVEFLMIGGGGGGGGNDVGGGGGAGGLIHYPGSPLDVGTHIVFAGAGGEGGTPTTGENNPGRGFSGESSTFSSPTQDSGWPTTSLVALGGAGGGFYSKPANVYGGCGGGNWIQTNNNDKGVQESPTSPLGQPANSITYGEGYPGGSSNPPGSSGGDYCSGGGGGTGGVGGTASTPTAGNGGSGSGLPWTPTRFGDIPGFPGGTFGGGGGGGGQNGTAGEGGLGGGGDGLTTSGSGTAGSGSNFSGGGGGGSDWQGGDGGEGFVICRYPVS
tara:strand:- start:40 stop:1104 length:1065 start_codon:yes stop_codon:yes gene_type:complete